MDELVRFVRVPPIQISSSESRVAIFACAHCAKKKKPLVYCAYVQFVPKDSPSSSFASKIFEITREDFFRRRRYTTSKVERRDVANSKRGKKKRTGAAEEQKQKGVLKRELKLNRILRPWTTYFCLWIEKEQEG